MTKRNPASETSAMESLSQAATAWLLGINTRSLRDHATLPRNEDGSYNAQHVVAAARKELRLPELSDDDYERALLIGEHIDAEAIEKIRNSVEFLTAGIQERYKCSETTAFLVIWRAIWADKIATIDIFPDHCDFGPDTFSIVHVCGCGRWRHGRTWKSTKPPQHLRPLESVCPDCVGD